MEPNLLEILMQSIKAGTLMRTKDDVSLSDLKIESLFPSDRIINAVIIRPVSGCSFGDDGNACQLQTRIDGNEPECIRSGGIAFPHLPQATGHFIQRKM